MRFSLTVFSSLLVSASQLDRVGAFAPQCMPNQLLSSVAQKTRQSAQAAPSCFSATSLRSSSEDAEDEIVPIDVPEEDTTASADATVANDVATVVEEESESTTDIGEQPSDVPVGEPEEETVVETPVPLSEEEMMENLLFLQSVSAITSRGEYASKAQKRAIQTVVAKLEASNPNPEPTITTDLMEGTWELVMADNGQLFRSSPFFMAGRAVCSTPEQAKQYDWFCSMHRKALAISNIVSVRQIVSRDRLVSEFVSSLFAHQRNYAILLEIVEGNSHTCLAGSQSGCRSLFE